MNVTYTVDCHCGSAARMTVMHLGMDPSDLVIDVEMTIGQASFECPDCGCETYTGDIETYSEDEESCGSDEDAEDDDDDEDAS